MTADVGPAILREPGDIDTCDMPIGRGNCMRQGDHKGGCLPAPVRRYRNSDLRIALRRAA